MTLRCAACNRPLHRHEAACLGHWSTVAAFLRWIGDADRAGMELAPVFVCRGRCAKPRARQRLAFQFVSREVAR